VSPPQLQRLPSMIGQLRAPQPPADPHLRAALAEERQIGQRIAAQARSVTVVILLVLLPVLSRDPGVVFSMALLLGLLATDLLRRRFVPRNTGRLEMSLLAVDLVLLLFLTVLPNPFLPDKMPGALTYNTGKFVVFYILLALSTLAYSWRQVLIMAGMIAATWLIGAGIIDAFGHRNAEIAAALQPVFDSYPRLQNLIDPNQVRLNQRFQEAIALLIVAALLGLKSWRSEKLILRQAELAAERANLSRYFSPNMVDLLATQSATVGAVRRAEVGVLFADIVGFTKLAETLPPEVTVDILRSYYAAIEAAIFEHGGTLDKYLGDGVMATFGTPEPGPDDAAHAVRAAKGIIAAISALNETEPDPTLRIAVSVGVHFGPVTLGDVGPARRLEFAVLGDTVNVASRLESATRGLGCQILCSDAVIRRSGIDAGADGFALRPGLQLRGRAQNLDVWTFGTRPLPPGAPERLSPAP